MRRTQGILGGRSDGVVRRVLAAALTELARSGYAGFRMDEVAARAGVNKTTVYRRWPSRASLVSALVQQMRAPLRERPLPDTGDIEDDLVEAFAMRFRFAREVEGRAWARLLDERHNREVKAIIHETVVERGDEWKSLVTRACDRGELPRGTDAQLLLHFIRAIVDANGANAKLDPSLLRIAVRTVLAGAREGTLTKRRARPATSKR